MFYDLFQIFSIESPEHIFLEQSLDLSLKGEISMIYGETNRISPKFH